jgi:hypothetical protein
VTGTAAPGWGWETATDPEEVHALLCACDRYQAERYDSPVPERNLRTTRLRVGAGAVHVLRHAGEAVATLTVTSEPPFEPVPDTYTPAVRPAYLGRLAVAPRLLATGAAVGVDCVRRAVAVASAQGADWLRSEANPDLAGTVRLLELLGFRRSGAVLASGRGVQRVRMEKPLGPPPTGSGGPKDGT